MKARFLEILQDHCDEFGEQIEFVLSKSRRHPRPMIKALTITAYLAEYNTPLKTIGEWLGGIDHSSVIYLRDNVEQWTYKPIVKDYSRFVSFGYNKVRFTYKYV